MATYTNTVQSLLFNGTTFNGVTANMGDVNVTNALNADTITATTSTQSALFNGTTFNGVTANFTEVNATNGTYTNTLQANLFNGANAEFDDLVVTNSINGSWFNIKWKHNKLSFNTRNLLFAETANGA